MFPTPSWNLPPWNLPSRMGVYALRPGERAPVDLGSQPQQVVGVESVWMLDGGISADRTLEQVWGTAW